LDAADREAPYKFSSDADIREAEKKLRRSCIKAIHQGGLDLDEMFKRYDNGDDGTIMRSDFVQVLMELGLSLLDGANGSNENDRNGGNGDSMRQKQLAALSSYKGNSGKRAAKLRDRRPQLFSGGDSNGDAFNDEKEALNMIKWYVGERAKRRILLLRS